MTRLDPRGERGAVAVIVAFMLPALLAVSAIVLDLANQWVHKRHLQSQADAAAFAGAQLLRAPCNATIEGQVATEVDKYAGATTSTGLAVTPAALHYNQQLDVPQGNEQVLGLLNSPTYPDNQGGPNNGEPNTGHPCADAAVDVKLTDKNVPFLAASGIPLLSSTLSSFGHINVHARVALKKATQATGLLPYAVMQPEPQRVEARLFTDAGTGTVGPKAAAVGGTDVTPVTLLPTSSDPDTFTGTFTGTLPGTRYSAVNVQIATSGAPSPISLQCTAPLEQCYPATPSGSTAPPPTGLVQSRVWAPNSATPGSGDVALFYYTRFTPTGVAGCGNDGYFARITKANCAANVNVTVAADFQNGTTYPDPTKSPKPSDKAVVCMATSTTDWPTAPAVNNPSCKGGVQLQYAGTETPTGGHHLWTGSIGGLPDDTTGGVTFASIWAIVNQGTVGTTQCKTSGCEGPAVHAQQFYSGAPPITGAIDAVSVVPNERSDCSSCPTSTLTISVHFKPFQAAQNPSDPRVILRVGSTPQSNQTLNCDTGGTGTKFSDQIANGCKLTFRIWDSSNDPPCYPTFNKYQDMQSPPVSAGPAGPFPCVQQGSGAQPADVAKGMNARVLPGAPANTCPDADRNHWPSDPNATLPDFESLHDNRLVPVFVTRNGAFANLPSGGNRFVPVVGFAEFYITGWTGNNGSQSDPCADTTKPLPPGASYDDQTSSPGTVIGHFVQEIDPSFSAPGDTACDMTGINPCVPVLVD